MMLCSTSAENLDSLELEPATLYLDAPDFDLLVRVRYRVLTAKIETRVSCAAWHGFVQERECSPIT